MDLVIVSPHETVWANTALGESATKTEDSTSSADMAEDVPIAFVLSKYL